MTTRGRKHPNDSENDEPRQGAIPSVNEGRGKTRSEESQE